MKLKEFRGISTSKYFYHKNGFVDSISEIGNGIAQINISQKFIYDSQNNLHKIKTIVKSYSDQTIEHKIGGFIYNELNQIVTVISHVVNRDAYMSMDYNYDSEGHLLIYGRVYSNENLIQEGNLFYSYDDKKILFMKCFLWFMYD